ncbi:MAG: S16 family serine protease, partial [Gammaproteobacteria bacterium]
LIPEENAKDLNDIPKNILKQLEIKTVRWIDEVLELALASRPVPAAKAAAPEAEPAKATEDKGARAH